MGNEIFFKSLAKCYFDDFRRLQCSHIFMKKVSAGDWKIPGVFAHFCDFFRTSRSHIYTYNGSRGYPEYALNLHESLNSAWYLFSQKGNYSLLSTWHQASYLKFLTQTENRMSRLVPLKFFVKVFSFKKIVTNIPVHNKRHF